MLFLVRTDVTDDSIIGELYIDGTMVCKTLENKKLAIPCGKYKLENSLSPKFKKELPLIYNDTDVKPNRGIRIHNGTTSSNSAGCVLVGMDVVGDRLKDSLKAEQMVAMVCRNSNELIISEI